MVKDFVINNSMNLVKELNKYDETQLEEIKYGIESTYLGITKIITILLISIIINQFKETITFFILFNIIRITGFGLHASKSIWCWIASIISFIGIPFLCKTLQVNNLFYIITSVISIICFVLYAPADTIKRPLINKRKRKIYKVITIIIGIVYYCMINSIPNFLYKNMLVFALMLETILILPITYKIFNLSYNNYKKY